MDDACGIALEDRFGRGHRLRRAAAHDRQRALFGTRLPAGHGRVEHQQIARCSLVREAAGDGGGDGGVVGEQRAGAHRGKGAIGAQRHLLQVRVVADAGEHRIGALGCIGGRTRDAAAVLFRPGIRLCAGAIVDGDLVSGAHQVARHRGAHHAHADECDLHGRRIEICAAGRQRCRRSSRASATCFRLRRRFDGKRLCIWRRHVP